jgi:hypothetical protein
MVGTTAIYAVIEPTDALYVNFFTDEDECKAWAGDGDKLGDSVIGPFFIRKDRATPFNIFLGCDATEKLEAIYAEGTVTDEIEEKHDTILGRYTVYESISEFESEKS